MESAPTQYLAERMIKAQNSGAKSKTIMLIQAPKIRWSRLRMGYGKNSYAVLIGLNHQTPKYACGNGRADNAGNIRGHGMHEQKI